MLYIRFRCLNFNNTNAKMNLSEDDWMLRVDNHSYVSSPPDETYMTMLKQIIERDDAIQKIAVLPNWSYSWLQVPDGMVVKIDATQPFKADLFFTNMWAGCSMTEATDVDEYSLPQRGALVKRAIKTVSTNPPNLLNSDKKFWSASLGSHDNYIGLYSTDRTNSKTHMLQKMYMIVADTSLDEAVYAQMEEYFEQCEERKMSYRDVFYNNKNTEALRALIMRNRRNLVYEFASALGVKVPFRKYTKASHEMNIAQYSFETEYNTVKFENGSHTMLFYRGCTCTDDVKKALIFSRSPLEGPVMYVGPKANKEHVGRLFDGLRWKNDLFNSFPVHMGRNIDKSDWHDMQRKLGLSTSELSKRLICDGELDESGFLLHSYPYRERDSKWVSIEKSLGYVYESQRVLCRPLIVKIS